MITLFHSFRIKVVIQAQVFQPIGFNGVILPCCCNTSASNSIDFFNKLEKL
jgi:hypothetical protein